MTTEKGICDTGTISKGRNMRAGKILGKEGKKSKKPPGSTLGQLRGGAGRRLTSQHPLKHGRGDLQRDKGAVVTSNTCAAHRTSCRPKAKQEPDFQEAHF